MLFRVSDNTLRKETERFGELQKAREEEWKRQTQDETWLQDRLQQYGKQAGRLYGSMDGVMAPCKGEWREMKNIAWYQVEPIRSYEKRRHHASVVGEQNDLQARDITYHCDIQSPDQFGALFWATACQRKADLHEELVFVCDGAVWIWKLIERHLAKYENGHKQNSSLINYRCLLSHTGAAHHERCPHTRPGFVASHRAAAHLHAPNDLLRVIVGPGHVRLPVEDPVIGPMFTQTDEQQAQLIQGRQGLISPGSALWDLLPQFEQASTTFQG